MTNHSCRWTPFTTMTTMVTQLNCYFMIEGIALLRNCIEQPGAGWGRVAQGGLLRPLRRRLALAAGTGVHVYILDSGIRTSHSEFSGDSPRAFAAFDAVTPGGDAQDCHSHGTHVAAIVGGERHQPWPLFGAECLCADTRSCRPLPVRAASPSHTFL